MSTVCKGMHDYGTFEPLRLLWTKQAHNGQGKVYFGWQAKLHINNNPIPKSQLFPKIRKQYKYTILEYYK